jgi:predicted MFS family arabinose efflux permease
MTFLTAVVATITVGFSLAGYNQVASVVTAQILPKKGQLMISLINDASITGLGFGSFFANKIVQRGRLKSALFANFLIILGCIP